MPRRRSSPALLAASCALLLAACVNSGGGPTATTAAPATQAPITGAPATVSPTAAASPVPTRSPVPRPSGSLAWPLGDPVELPPGRYFSAPPFDIPFTIDVAETGWETGHLHADFFDLFRFDAGPTPSNPTHWIAFAHPAFIRGSGPAPGSDLPSAGLAPQAAIEALVAREDVVDSNVAEQSLFGLEGMRVDLRALASSTHLFGGDGGTFGLDPVLPVRLVALPIEDGLLLVLVLAPADELEAVWDQALEILATVELVGG